MPREASPSIVVDGLALAHDHGAAERDLFRRRFVGERREPRLGRLELGAQVGQLGLAPRRDRLTDAALALAQGRRSVTCRLIDLVELDLRRRPKLLDLSVDQLAHLVIEASRALSSTSVTR